MYPVRVPPAPRPPWTSTPVAGLPTEGPASPRTAAFLDVLCPRCEQRGLGLSPSGTCQAVLVCPHCGFVGRG